MLVLFWEFGYFMNIKDTLEASKKNIDEAVRRVLVEISESGADIMKKLDRISETRELLRGLDLQSYTLQREIESTVSELIEKSGRHIIT